MCVYNLCVDSSGSLSKTKTRFPGGGDASSRNLVAVLNIEQLRQEYLLHQIVGDGNCLFRCIAKHVYGNEAAYYLVRQQIVDELKRPEKEWNNHVNIYDPVGTVHLTKDSRKASFNDYVNHLSTDGTFGDVGCLYIAEEIYSDFTWKIFDTFQVPKGYAKLSQCSERLTDAVANEQPWAVPLGTAQQNVLHLFYHKFHYEYITSLEESDFDMVQGRYHVIAGT